jgi:queuine tRNA-ribosyltransferase
MLGVIGGGANDKMRDWSCQQTRDRAPSGFVLGGLSAVTDFEEVLRVVAHSAKQLPAEKLLVALGGAWDDGQVRRLVAAGVDLIASSLPSDRAASGIALMFPAREVDLSEARFLLDTAPIDGECACYACRHHSRGYLHHLLATKEMLATTLLTIHNTWRFVRLFRQLRQSLYAPAQ